MASEAGRLIERLPEPWSGASVYQRRRLLLTMSDAIYVDSKENTIVAIEPKARFKPIFEVATTREGSGVVLVHDTEAKPHIVNQPPPGGQEADESCSWWRRGRVELYREHGIKVLLAA